MKSQEFSKFYLSICFLFTSKATFLFIRRSLNHQLTSLSYNRDLMHHPYRCISMEAESAKDLHLTLQGLCAFHCRAHLPHPISEFHKMPPNLTLHLCLLSRLHTYCFNFLTWQLVLSETLFAESALEWNVVPTGAYPLQVGHAASTAKQPVPGLQHTLVPHCVECGQVNALLCCVFCLALVA